MGVEIENAKEAIRLIRKDTPQHISLVLGLYALSCKEPELGKVARASYFFMRHMDDRLDGDMQAKGEPLPYALEVRRQIQSDEFTGNPKVALLAQYAIKTLESRSRNGDNPKFDFLEAVDSIIFDYERSKEKKTLTQQELDLYYWKTFSPVINILLVGLKSNLRAKDIPALAMNQGRLYTIRDLETDWDRGTINIPSEVLEHAGLTVNSTFAELMQNLRLQKWFRESSLKSRAELLKLQQQLRDSGEDLTFLICNRLIKWMLAFVDRYDVFPRDKKEFEPIFARKARDVF